ncbi:MAG TPA: PaaI family thioesterase [Ktedonobacterales bacterium]|nr:PaaI family thioesterase [Ktedonobacterales bacterium]
MSQFQPQDPDYEERVRASFGRQRVMDTIGAALSRVAPGEVDITLPFREDLTQQHGFLHAGIVTTIVDSACGYAALSLMPPDVGVLTVEYKVNLLAPASGTSLIARGRVTKPGRTITVCAGDVYAYTEGENGREKLVATMLATMMTVRERAGIAD